MGITRVCRLTSVVFLGVVAAVGVKTTPVRAAAQAANQGPVTFTKDVMPILQRSCQTCHRPDSFAPMSLMTFQDVRPWARSIRQRVVAREMPPWYIDRTVGIQKFKNDVSLSDRDIDTIVQWVDGGTAEGDRADMPPPRQFTDADKWSIPKPDLIVSTPEMTLPPVGPDWWPNYVVDSGLTEDRYIKAVDVKSTNPRAVHHIGTSMLFPDEHGEFDEERREELEISEIGKNGAIFPDGTARFIKAGSKITFGMHYHPIGEEIKTTTSVGIVFYPKGYVPKYKVDRFKAGGGTYMNLDIPAGQESVRTDGYTVVKENTVLVSFQPHMHSRGSRLCLEAIYPNGTIETLSCAKHNFEWMVNYIYADDSTPLIPAGTILHSIGWHDNSPKNKYNPDPRNWAGFGNRSIDDMSFAHVTAYTLDETEFQRRVAERWPDLKAAPRRSN